MGLTPEGLDNEGLMKELQRNISKTNEKKIKIYSKKFKFTEIPFEINGIIKENIVLGSIDDTNIIGPLAISIQEHVDATILSILEKSIDSIKTSLKGNDIKSYLVISRYKISEQVKSHFKSIQTKFNDKELTILLWDNIDLYKFLYVNISNKIDFEEIVKLQNQRCINTLKNKYNTNDLVIFLGAGISKSANLPDWKTLIATIYQSFIQKEISNKNQISLNLNETFSKSPYINAELIKAGLKKKYNSAIYDELYKNITKSKQLSAISKMTNVKAIISYNYDDLLERILFDLKIRFRVIFNQETLSKDDEVLNIYHVHGFLPISQDWDSEKCQIIFTDEDLNSLLTDQYHWSNIIQLYYLSNYTCLFLGVSFDDQNIRRLLRYHHQQRPSVYHYAIKKKQDIQISNEQNEETKRKVNIIHQKLLEETYDELGIKVIWVNDYKSENPGIIREISSQ